MFKSFNLVGGEEVGSFLSLKQSAMRWDYLRVYLKKKTCWDWVLFVKMSLGVRFLWPVPQDRSCVQNPCNWHHAGSRAGAQ